MPEPNHGGDARCFGVAPSRHPPEQQGELYMDKQELISQIQRESTLWSLFLADIDEERMVLPGAMGEWTFKDVVAHISGWRKRTLARLEAAGRDEEFSFSLWPAEWDVEDDVDKINDWIYQQNRDRPLNEVLEESRQQFRQMEELVRAIPDEDLFDPNRFDWIKGYSAADLVDYSFGHFHEEHEPDLQAWLSRS